MGELWGWIMLCFLNKATGVQLWKMLNASNEGCFVPLCNILLLRPIVNYLRQVRRKCKSEERGWNHESLWILSQRNWAWTRLYGHKSLNHNHCHLLLSQAPENVSSDFDSALCWFKIYLEECVEDSKQRQIAGSEPGWHLYHDSNFCLGKHFSENCPIAISGAHDPASDPFLTCSTCLQAAWLNS